MAHTRGVVRGRSTEGYPEKEETRNGTSARYSYDAAGNRLSKEDAKGRTNYHYNEKNQLVSLEENGTKKQFTYSRQGSILTEEGAEGTRRYVYNSRNQQIRVECENGAVQENYYDAEGLRHETLENEKLLRLVYHRGELLYEGGEREETSYYLGAGTEGIQRNGESFYYHQDEQLSEALITDTGGRIQNHYQYDAFGAELNVMERIPNRIRYTGQQYDRLTEQYYLRARYYNPILGRFMQEDEYLGDGLNLYAYCENNPVMYYDPSGYSSYEAKVGSGIGDEGGSKSGSSSRYDRTGYQSNGRSNNLFGRDRSTRRTTNLTEWRRSISQQDIHNEMRLFLGDDYVKIDSGKWRSLDGTRQFRVKPDDYLGNHGIGQPTVPNTPHVHFEFLTPRSNGNGFDVIKNIHVPIK